MGRLIDADRFIEKVNKDREHECYLHSWTADMVLERLDSWYAPTVEAIPKAEVNKFLEEVNKFLEEGTKNVSNNVLAIVREDYIPKADYENRLKTDMVAMLTEMKKEIHEISTTPNTSKGFKLGQATAYYKCEFLIEQKINELREGEL